MPSTVKVRLRRMVNSSYEIIIGGNLPRFARDIVHQSPHSKRFVITDTNVGKLYGKYFRKPHFHLVVVPAGERSKSRKMKEILEDKLLAVGVNRDSLIIALGGGMIGDLAGFVAATLLRGIPYVQIPTTLLAQVDSSIGGKVAVDHPSGKNLLGAFYQPRKVYVDIDTLKTVSHREFSNGMAEVIKYAAIFDPELFDQLEQQNSEIKRRHRTTLLPIIKRCCELKKKVVEKDEKESDYRRILNFGHTIGHAIERLSNYRIPHGRAVAIGMVMEANMSSLHGILPRASVERLESLLKSYNLPTEIPSTIGLNAIVSATKQDKKVLGGIVQYTLLDSIGRAQVGVGLSAREVQRLLKR